MVVSVVSARPRVSDDLYKLYLAGLGWLLLPFYGAALATVIPTEWNGISEALSMSVPVLGLFGAWSGLRGGPMVVYRAGVVQGLLSPTSRRRFLLPRLLRQTVAWMIVAALVVSVVWSMVDSGSFEYRSMIVASAVAALAAASSSFQAVLWSIAVHGGDSRVRPLAAAAAGAVPAAQISALLAGLSFSSATGFLILLGTVALGGFLAAVFLDKVPIDVLWRRAGSLESVRSAMATVDVQRVFLNLRKAAEPPVAASPPLTFPPWFPVSLWCLCASFRHHIRLRLGRVAAIVGVMAATYTWGEHDQGAVVLVIAGCAFLLGMEVSEPITATAAQPVFLLHYPSGSSSVLRGQVATTVLLVLAVGVVVTGFGLFESWRVLAGIALLAVSGALGAAVQARLGSPDLAAMLDKFGIEILGLVLWMRALLAPALVIVATVGVFHQFFRQESPAVPFGLVSIAVGVAAFVISTRPLEDPAP